MKRLTVVVMLALFATSGCVSQKSFLADAAAERIYRENAYERACVQVKGPQSCTTAQAALNLLEHHDATGKPVGLIPLANTVQQLGKLPADEKAEIKVALKKAKVQ